MKFLGVWSVLLAVVCAISHVSAKEGTCTAPNTYLSPGTLQLHSTHPLSFRYKTPAPHTRNWVAVYNVTDWAVKYPTGNQSSLLWKYASEGDGIVKFPNNKLSTGSYTAVFLEDDGYRRVAEPLAFHFDDDLPGTLDAIATSPLILKYSTAIPNPKNWVGLYPASGGGPERGEWASDAVAYKYAPKSLGEIVLDTSGLPNGSYKAFFLADDGYKWVGPPVELQLGDDTNGYAGSFSVSYKYKPDKNKGTVTVRYTCKEPNPRNWVGIWYSYGGGPEHEGFVDDALAWGYASEAEGSLTLRVDKLDRKSPYKVFFLADNGYKWLSPPIAFGMRTRIESFKFILDPFKTHPARQGEYWEQDISGMLTWPGNPNTRFVFSDNDEGWMKIDYLRGKVFGTPGRKQKDLTVTLMARAGAYKSFMDMKTPVRKAGTPLVERLKVLTLNLWDGGEPFKKFHEKQILRIVELDVDIVALQGSGKWHGARIAYTLGWHHWQGEDVSIIGRFPMKRVFPAETECGAVQVSLDGDDIQLMVWNGHLSAASYGPYQFCFDGSSTHKVMQSEANSERMQQLHNITEKMHNHIANADKIPVLFMGNLNSPSHLDWTNSTKERHCGVGAVPWPTSKHLHDVGLIDSFRVANPDPEVVPGITWSPIYLNNNGRPEPQDRTDFIYYKGSRLKVLSSETVMLGANRPIPKHAKNEWTSDHMGVLTEFEIE